MGIAPYGNTLYGGISKSNPATIYIRGCMQTMKVDNEFLITVNKIAHQLKISQQAILKHAVEDYVKKINKHQTLLAFAGILQESEADKLLQTIQHNRVNKETKLDL
jgi:predicted transcriptional regulator